MTPTKQKDECEKCDCPDNSTMPTQVSVNPFCAIHGHLQGITPSKSEMWEAGIFSMLGMMGLTIVQSDIVIEQVKTIRDRAHALGRYEGAKGCAEVVKGSRPYCACGEGSNESSKARCVNDAFTYVAGLNPKKNLV